MAALGSSPNSLAIDFPPAAQRAQYLQPVFDFFHQHGFGQSGLQRSLRQPWRA